MNDHPGDDGNAPRRGDASALQGIRVLDLSRVLAGPWCGQLLADLGARVIKIERPHKGDDCRAWGPPYMVDDDKTPSVESSYYYSCNRGKESVTVDFTTGEGRSLIEKLALASDVLIENYKVGTLDRHGIGFSQLSKINPGLIYCAITGFGQDGPYKNQPAYDTIIQGLGGLMSVTGHQDGLPGGGPMKVGLPLIDMMTGLYAVVAILAALRRREVTGKGQYVDISLLDVQVSSLANVGLNYLVSGDVPVRKGNRTTSVYPSDAFRCREGYLMLYVSNNERFAEFCKITGLHALLRDARFSSNQLRLENADMLAPVITDALSSRSAPEWIAAFQEAGIPCGPINDISQVFDDPQVKARNMVIEIAHRSLGKNIPSIANPIRLSESPIQYRRPPPTLGEHTAQVLSELAGLSSEAISNLSKSGII